MSGCDDCRTLEEEVELAIVGWEPPKSGSGAATSK
jgi:hypothetical protein